MSPERRTRTKEQRLADLKEKREDVREQIIDRLREHGMYRISPFEKNQNKKIYLNKDGIWTIEFNGHIAYSDRTPDAGFHMYVALHSPEPDQFGASSYLLRNEESLGIRWLGELRKALRMLPQGNSRKKH